MSLGAKLPRDKRSVSFCTLVVAKNHEYILSRSQCNWRPTFASNLFPMWLVDMLCELVGLHTDTYIHT